VWEDKGYNQYNEVASKKLLLELFKSWIDEWKNGQLNVLLYQFGTFYIILTISLHRLITSLLQIWNE